MKIAVIGAGYVGAVTGSCLAEMGHSVAVVDKDISKVEKLQRGLSPISEPFLGSLLEKVTQSGNFTASSDLHAAISGVDVVLVSVGTPTNTVDGSADLRAVIKVFEELREALNQRVGPLAIAITSTVPPGTTENLARKILEKSGQNEGKFTLAFIPEFLREGTAIEDFKNPSRYIVGISPSEQPEVFLRMRPDLSDRTHIVAIEEAEMLKTVENAWHATKIVFANEVGRISRAIGVDGASVMKLLMLDTKQNISKTYMRPGFAFGGSCLPKDVKSLVRVAEMQAVSAPLLSSLIPSNKAQLDLAEQQIVSTGRRKIGILGLAFKAETDDIRESPALYLIERLIGQGFEIAVHDFEALRHDLYGANLATFDRHPHIRKVMVEQVAQVVQDCEVIVLAQHNRKYLQVLQSVSNEKLVIDLTGLIG